MNEQFLREKLINSGATLVGFCKLDSSPIKEQPNLIYAISIAYKLSDSVLKSIIDRPSISYFQHYRAVNSKLDSLSLDCVRYIESFGYNAFPIPASQSDPKLEYSGIFQHKTVARLSGLGYIGKNAMLITKEFGSKVRLCSILTDMPLIRDYDLVEDLCGDCEICKNSCPAGAIYGVNVTDYNREEYFNAEKCSNNMKRYQDVGRGAVCGICIKTCPKNKLM